MGGSSGGSQKTDVNTKSTPWEGVQPFLLDLYNMVGGLQQPQYYPGETVAPMSDLTKTGIDSALGFVDNVFPQAYNKGLQSMYDMQNYVDVANNPYVQGMNQQLANEVMASGRQQIGDYASTMNDQLGSGMFNLNRGIENQARGYNSMLGDMTRNYMTNILPGITSNAVGDEGLGGSRQALAQIGSNNDFNNQLEQGISNAALGQSRNYQDLAWGMGNAYSDTARQLQNAISNNQMALSRGIADTNLGAYNTGVNAQIAALQMMPEYMNLGLMPSNVYGQAGQTVEGYQQRQIDADIARWDYAQNAPWQMASNLNAIYSGATPYASSSSTTKTPSYSNPWATAGALGLGAYGLWNA